MALFFKHIRQKLLVRKRFGKYSLYAVGEVLILIVGILVAVEVNNWNERNQQRDAQKELLKSIKTELELDFDLLSSDKEVHESVVRSSLILINHLENNFSYHDSLNKHFLETTACTILTLNKGGYETLKSLGVGIIQNTDLRKKIIYLYDGHYSFLGELLKDLQNNFRHGELNVWNSRFVEAENYTLELGEHKEGLDAIGEMVPLDFDILKDDHEYLYYLRTTKNKHKIYIQCLEDTNKKISEAILGIDQELNALEQ